MYSRKSLWNLGLALVLLSGPVLTSVSCKSSKKAAKTTKTEKESDEARRQREDRERETARKKNREQKSAELDRVFGSIANAYSADAANQSISTTLSQFSSPDAPVLIIISRDGSDVDYDKPTSIKKYLEYLKDTKKTLQKVEKVEFDSNEKIKELILINK